MLFNPKLVISLRGIRTYGFWQRILGRTLKENKIQHKSFPLGYYSLLKFLFRRNNDKMVDSFYEYFCSVIANNKYDIDLDNTNKRPSVIAHSFGSYIVGYCLLKYPDMKVDKIILCGSILPSNFDWSTILIRNQANYILNEYGQNDFWTKIVKYIIPMTGDSGFKGFDYISAFIFQNTYLFKHSDYFKGKHIENYWLPFLLKTPAQFSIKHGKSYKELYDFSKLFERTTIIDEESFGNNPVYKNVDPSNDLALTWININPDIYTFLFDSDHILQGYFNALPISDKLFSKLMKGMIQDNEVNNNDILPFNPNQKIKIYLMSMAISKTTREKNVGLFNEPFEKLINAFFDKLYFYAINYKIIVSDFIAVGWSPEGIHLCNVFGMKKIKSDKYGNPIFHLNIFNNISIPSKSIFPRLHDLMKVYSSIGNHKNG